MVFLELTTITSGKRISSIQNAGHLLGVNRSYLNRLICLIAENKRKAEVAERNFN